MERWTESGPSCTTHGIYPPMKTDHPAELIHRWIFLDFFNHRIMDLRHIREQRVKTADRTFLLPKVGGRDHGQGSDYASEQKVHEKERLE